MVRVECVCGTASEASRLEGDPMCPRGWTLVYVGGRSVAACSAACRERAHEMAWEAEQHAIDLLAVTERTEIGRDAGGPVYVLPPRSGSYEQRAAVGIMREDGRVRGLCPGCGVVISTASAADITHDCDTCKIRVLLPGVGEHKLSECEHVKKVNELAMIVSRNAQFSAAADARMAALTEAPTPTEPIRLPVSTTGVCSKCGGGCALGWEGACSSCQAIERFVPGALVWHKVTGEGPWTLVQRTEIPTTQEVPRADGQRQHGNLTLDGWTVEIAPGRFRAMPEVVLVLAEPERRASLLVVAIVWSSTLAALVGLAWLFVWFWFLRAGR